MVSRARLSYLLLAPTAFMLLVVFGYPVFQLVRLSLVRVGIGDASDLFIGFNNYELVLRDIVFWRAIKNNITLFLAVPIIVTLAVFVAAILRDQMPGWRFFQTLFFVPYILAVAVAAIIFSRIYTLDGVLNTILHILKLDFLSQDWIGDPGLAIFSVMGVIVWKELGFGIILFLARMLSIPEELFDAAKIDGANWYQRFIHVTIPQVRGQLELYIMFLLITMLSWVFGYIYVMTLGGPGFSTYVSEFYIYQNAFRYGRMGVAAAVSLLILIVTLIVIWVQFRIRGEEALD